LAEKADESVFVAIGEPRENLGQKADARGGLTERNGDLHTLQRFQSLLCVRVTAQFE
jgi:hypothetical protein